MKKKNIINLIKYHAEKNEFAFRNEAYEIAHYFDDIGDYQLAEYIMAIMSDTNIYVPQELHKDLTYLKKIDTTSSSLLLPDVIKEDIIGVINAIKHNVGINKFFFEGFPGTGKSESAKHIARILERDLLIVNFESVIDSKLGQTSKNILQLFEEINNLPHPNQVVILFDEMDAIAMNRVNSNDMREMGRATTTILKGMENVNQNIVMIATTNLYDSFDKALTRRFDAVINFDRYSRDDLISISENILNSLLNTFSFAGRNMRLFKKIINLLDNIYYPGEMKNLLKKSLAFSNSNYEFDYLRRLYSSVKSSLEMDVKTLKNEGFTLREIEILTGVPKSSVARDTKGD